MKYFGLVHLWMLSLVLGSLLSSIALIEADPTDDFSMSLGHSMQAKGYDLLPETRVSEILADRLDLFPKSQLPRLAHHIVFLCKKYRFDPAFILSLIQVESSFRIKALSPVGAVGLMQVMVPTAHFVVQKLGFHFSGYENFGPHSLSKRVLTRPMLMDPYVNTAIGIAYLAWLRDYYRGSTYRLLAAYNVGPGRMDELLAQKSFKPTETKRYFQLIRQGVPRFRFYQKSASQRRL
jgi:hypothetical protein